MPTTTTTELHTCGMCGREFPLAGGELGLFGHPCEGDEASLRRIRGAEAVADHSQDINVDRPDHWSGGAKNPRPRAPRPSGLRANKFAGTCATCAGHVEAGAGTLERKGDRWLVKHRAGECGPTPAPSITAAPAPTRSSRPPLPDVPEGHYAIASKGNNDLLFVRVDRPTEGRWSGYTFVKMIVGGKPDAPIRGAQAADVLARITAAGIEAAATLYGTEIGRCYRCNRSLTDKTSRELGIGPECRSKAA